MKAYLVAPEAEDDLRHIWRHLLGEAGLAVADRIQVELVDNSKGWPTAPGKAINAPTSPAETCSSFSVYQYMIVYRRAGMMEIVTVLHGKRNLRRFA